MGEGQGEGPCECNGDMKTHVASSMSVETVDVMFQKPSSRPSPVKREKEDLQTRGSGVRRDAGLRRTLDQSVTNVPSPIGWGRVSEGPSECNGGVKTHHTSSMSVETVGAMFQKPSSRPSHVKREKVDLQTRGCGVRRDTDLGRNLDPGVAKIPSPIGWGRV